jgi:ATP-dependent HslUV protease ATP-binding subunit HslU
MESSFSPREIVSELDKFIIGQKNAKKAVAVALRNRWRRKQLPENLKEEILPKNILMVGPTGCGKTEISRRLAKLANAPFIKVEATKFTEVGYVGRDVEQIIRDLVEISINQTKIQMGIEVKAQAEKNAEEKILDVLISKSSSPSTRESFRKKLRSGELNDKEVEIAIATNNSFNMPTMDIPGMPGSQMGMINLGDVLGKSFPQPKKNKKMTVEESHAFLIQEETEKLLDNDKIIKNAIQEVEQNGIVFIDEIDKITSRNDKGSGNVSREGVQRDLLPLIEGTTVSTKHGTVKTDYILFITSGAFHLSKPSDMLPELQGRLPIRVELEALTSNDFKRILKEPDYSLIKQYVALLKTENVELEFSDDGIDAIANMA